MKLKDEAAWIDWVENNKDPYGKACIDAARSAMEELDKGQNIDLDKLLRGRGLTGFQACCVAQMVSLCHERGEEFRKLWNLANQLGKEGEEANKGKGGGIVSGGVKCQRQ